jgi:hypothetical protein
MKKLITLAALMACFLGANAQQWEQVYKIDYSTYQDFPFYIMGYAPTMADGAMVDDPVPYRKIWRDSDNGYEEVADQCEEVTINGGTYYMQLLDSNPWRQYFCADGIATDIGSTYKVVAVVKVSEACTVHVNMGDWGSALGADVPFPASEEFTEVEWKYEEMPVSSCFLVAQPGVTDAVIEWKEITVYKKLKEGSRPKEWIEMLVNGDAETPWPAWALEETDGINTNWRGERTGEICAWDLTMGRNFDDQCAAFGENADRARPYPADIEEEEGNESNHVFVCHVDQVDKIDDDASIQWSNQFWIQSPQGWKEGTKIKISFRYKADKAATAATQIHKQYPSVYLHYVGIGDVNFSTEWQTMDKTITFDGSQGGGWSLAFNLCSGLQEPNTYYFDDLSWKVLKLDEGYFVAGIDAQKEKEYDYDNAIEFTKESDYDYTAEVGTKDHYVSQIMISTVRGDDAAYMGSTLKLHHAVQNDPDDWNDYEEAGLTKINLPGLGIWKIYLDTKYNAMAFEMLEGTMFEKVEIVPNTTHVVVHGQERDFTASEQPADEEAGVAEGTGQPWDNQFFIVANRTLSAGEATVIEFKYKSSVDAKTTTQCHVAPGAYLHWGAIGDVQFATDEQEFSTQFTVPSDANDMQSIAFNMAEIKEACDYEIWDIVWKLADDSETLIDMEGTKNFYVKEGANTNPYEFGTDPGTQEPIKGDVNDDGAVNVADISAVIDVMAGIIDKTDAADVNGDGSVNVADIAKIIDIMAGEVEE